MRYNWCAQPMHNSLVWVLSCTMYQYSFVFAENYWTEEHEKFATEILEVKNLPTVVSDSVKIC